MQEVIYEISNWTILKFLGGFTIVISAVMAFFSKYLLTRLTQSSQHAYNTEIEKIRGEIGKHNNLLTSIIQNHLSSSQKILDKKIQAYEMLWSNILEIRNNFPSGISLVYQIFMDDELAKDDAFEMLNNNPKMGPIFRSYNTDSEIKKNVEGKKSLLKLRPYISDDSIKLYHSYEGIIGRITYKFIWDYAKNRVYNWKKDNAFKSILALSLTDKEINYIMDTKIHALHSLIELIEYKILQDFKKNLNIKESETDTINYLKQIEALMVNKTNNSEWDTKTSI